jgi:ActR/RegA family two-component response regulator
VRVIIADDEASVRTLLGRYVRRIGAEAVECETVAQAMQAARTAFDAAVVDANLPDGSGLELAAGLALACPQARIVICSGLAVSPQSGVTNWTVLEKPFRVEKLMELIGLG